MHCGYIVYALYKIYKFTCNDTIVQALHLVYALSFSTSVIYAWRQHTLFWLQARDTTHVFSPRLSPFTSFSLSFSLTLSTLCMCVSTEREAKCSFSLFLFGTGGLFYGLDFFSLLLFEIMYTYNVAIVYERLERY